MNRRRMSWLLGCGLVALSGCATPPRPADGANENGPWSGRLALQVKDQASQSFAAMFELRGTADERQVHGARVALQQDLGELRGLAGAGLAADDNDRVGIDRRADLVAPRVDRQRGVEVDLGGLDQAGRGGATVAGTVGVAPENRVCDLGRAGREALHAVAPFEHAKERHAGSAELLADPFEVLDLERFLDDGRLPMTKDACSRSCPRSSHRALAPGCR